MKDKATAKPQLEFHGSRLFTAWLAEAGVSLAFTTYQTGKIFMIGLNKDGGLSIYERTFPRPMGIGVRGDTIWVSGLQHMWRFENFLTPAQEVDGYDRLFVPVVTHLTGDIDVHDVHVNGAGKPLFIATRFNCLATLDDRHSFVPLKLPRFIDRLAAEDRCHLNGLAMQGDTPAFATAVSSTNVAESWRDNRIGGGVVIDLHKNEVIADGLSMPHSPRLHGDNLWLLNSGTGELGKLDRRAGKFEPVCFLPGFARGLSIVGHHAVVSLSNPRENRTFADLPFGERLARERLANWVGLAVVNLLTGDVEHRLETRGYINEIYDCAVMPGITSPSFLGLKSDQTRFSLKPAPIQS